MSTNNVVVTESFGTGAEGWYLFAAGGTLVTDANLAIVTPVVQGTLDASGNLSATLLASDSFSPGELNWNVFLNVRGMNQVHVIGFPVNFALGGTQTLFTVLSAAGWSPTSS